MSLTTHKWLIAFSDQALRHLRRLPSHIRMAVFTSLRGLLRAENPLAEPGVKKLKGGQAERLYRARAGSYRILFVLEVGSLVHEKAEYKGRLLVEAVKHRSEAYRP